MIMNSYVYLSEIYDHVNFVLALLINRPYIVVAEWLLSTPPNERMILTAKHSRLNQ